MKILHLPTATGGNSFGLSKAEKFIGLDSHVLYRSDGDFHYPYELLLSNSSKLINILFGAIKFHLFDKKKFTIFHFNYGSSIINYPKWGINNLDLFLFRANTIFVTYNGSDARQYFNKFVGFDRLSNDEAKYFEINKKKSNKIKKRISYFSKFSIHQFYLNPDLKKFLPENSTFIPYTLSNWEFIEPFPPVIDRDKIRIVHAPTNQKFKGTKYISLAIENLNKQYPSKIEFVLVENISHEKAIEVYKSADLIIDQLFAGWYGAFSVECMKMGKPIMVYIHDDDLTNIPNKMAEDLLNTIINVNLINIQSELERIILNKEVLTDYSSKSIKYSEKWHNPVIVAEIMKKHYLVANSNSRSK